MIKTILVSCAVALSIAACFRIFVGVGSASYATPHTAVLRADTSIDWESMDHKQRKDYMHDVVMPRMRHAFYEFDSVKFADVKCILCHGDGVKNQSFKMPNPKLPKLPNDREGWKKLNEKKADWMKFMGGVVKPEMAKLLGMQPFDSKTGKGFGCMECHTSE